MLKLYSRILFLPKKSIEIKNLSSRIYNDATLFFFFSGKIIHPKSTPKPRRKLSRQISLVNILRYLHTRLKYMNRLSRAHMPNPLEKERGEGGGKEEQSTVQVSTFQRGTLSRYHRHHPRPPHFFVFLAEVAFRFETVVNKYVKI